MITLVGFGMLLAAMTDGSVWPAYIGSVLVLTSATPGWIFLASILSFAAGVPIAGWGNLAIAAAALVYQRGYERGDRQRTTS